jgi:hypothetical protein
MQCWINAERYIPAAKIVGDNGHFAESSDERQENFATPQAGTQKLRFDVGFDFEHVHRVDATIANVVHAHDGDTVGGFASGLDNAI